MRWWRAVCDVPALYLALEDFRGVAGKHVRKLRGGAPALGPNDAG